MTQTQTSTTIRIVILAAIAALPIAFLFKQDSYWFDELWSLCLVSESFTRMFTVWLPYDVHPPLYYPLLWGWVRIFGYSEIATRSLSLLFFLITLMAFGYYSKRYNINTFVFGLVLLFTPLLAFYALEVRSYSLLFCLMTVFCCRYANAQNLDNRGRVLLMLVAFTHFFGLVVAGSFLLVQGLMEWRNKAQKQGLYWIWGMAWPLMPGIVFYIILLFFGKAIQYTGGNFWINSTTVEGLKMMADYLLPFHFLYPKKMAIAWLLVGLLFMQKTWRSSINKTGLLSLLLAAALLLAINLHTPIFMERYLLALLPLVWLAAFGMVRSWTDLKTVQQYLWIGLMGFTLVLLVRRNYINLARKTNPTCNVKAMAHYTANSPYAIYQLKPVYNQQVFEPYFYQQIGRFYMKKDHHHKKQIGYVGLAELNQLPRPFVLQCILQQPKAVMPKLQELGFKNLELIRFPMYNEDAFCVVVR